MTQRKKSRRTKKKTSRGKGRPAVMTRGVVNKLLKGARDGLYLETNAPLAGVDVTTARRWLYQGASELNRLDRKQTEREQGYEVPDQDLDMREQCKPYVEFCTAYKKAQAEGEKKLLDRIGEAGADHWQANAWRLERMHPSRYARPQRVEHTGKDGGPIETRGMVITPEKLKGLSDAELSVVKKLLGGGNA